MFGGDCLWYLQVKAWLEDGKDVRLGDWKAADIEILNTFQLLTAKSVVYLVYLLALAVTLSTCSREKFFLVKYEASNVFLFTCLL